MKLTNPKDGKTIESPYATDLAAAEALDAQPHPSSFAVSMWEAWNSGKSSEAQRFWLHKLTMPREAEAQKPRQTGIKLDGLREMFDGAKAHLKYPSLLLGINHGTEDFPNVEEVKLSIAGGGSRYRGQVMIASPKYGDAYYGRVDKDGNYFAGKDSSPDVDRLVKRMAVDPEGTAREFGRLTGKCCFCNRPLKDERSTTVGYGATCAKHFGLRWGTKDAATLTTSIS